MSWDLTLWDHGWVRAIFLLIVCLPLIRLIARASRQRLSALGNPHLGLLLDRVFTTLAVLIVVLSAAQQAGLDLTAFLATAGVVTVAVGFAAQTSLSNVISGLFLLVDRPFQVGEAVEIEGRAGVVESVTLLSTYIRTYDNVRVRWPNEVVLKSTILNYSRYPARRLEMKLRLVHGGDLERALARLQEVLGALPAVLLEPPPEVALRGYVDGAVEVELRAWVDALEVVPARTAITVAVHHALAEEKILVAGTVPAQPVKT